MLWFVIPEDPRHPDPDKQVPPPIDPKDPPPIEESGTDIPIKEPTPTPDEQPGDEPIIDSPPLPTVRQPQTVSTDDTTDRMAHIRGEFSRRHG